MWCNGNTRAFGALISCSSQGIPAKFIDMAQYPITVFRNTYGDIKYVGKNHAGQSMILIFSYHQYRFSHKHEYWVGYTVSNKRDVNSDKVYLGNTGRDGLYSLLWAKECIKDFIKYECRDVTDIYIEADDSKRFRVYKRGLRDLGFRETTYSFKGYSLRVLRLEVVKKD